MVFQRYFGGVLDLVDAHLEQLAQSCRGHGAGGTDLRLTAAFRTADGGVGLDKIADQPGHGQRAQHAILRYAALLLHVAQDAGQHAARAAGGRGDDDAAIGVLFADGEGIGADDAVFTRLRAFVDVLLLEEVLRLALYAQTAGQHAAAGKTLVAGGVHHPPDPAEEVPDVPALAHGNIIAQTQIVRLAVFGDVVKGVFRVDVGLFRRRLAGIAHVSPADAEGAQKARLLFAPAGDEVQRVGVFEGEIRAPGTHSMCVGTGESVLISTRSVPWPSPSWPESRRVAL